MPRIARNPNSLRGFTDDQVPFLRSLLEEMVQATNGNPFAAFEDVEVLTPAAPNTDFLITLKTLKAVPSTYQIVRVVFPRPGGGPGAGEPAALSPMPSLYDAPLTPKTRWTSGVAWLRCSVGAVKVTIRFT
jgi:hypothetical protein